MPKKKFLTTKMIVTLALLTALSIILTRFLSLQTTYVRVGIGNLPILLAGLLYGPIAGALTAFASDFLGTTLFSAFGWYPPLVVTPLIMGVLPALLRYLFLKKLSIGSVIACVLPAELLGPYLWTSLSLSWLYTKPDAPVTFLAMLSFRIPFSLVNMAADILLVFLLYKSGVFRTLGISTIGGSNNELRSDASIHSQRKMAGE